MQEISILPLGGCLLNVPLNEYNKSHFNVTPRVATGGSRPVTYSLSEMIQLVRLLRQDIDMPSDIKELAGMRPQFQPLPGIGDFRDVDVVLVEPSTPIDIHYGVYLLNRSAIFSKIIAPIREAYPTPEIAKMTNLWLTKGLQGGDEETRMRLGAELAGLVSDDMPLADTIRDVLVSARAGPCDVGQRMRELRSMFDHPMGVLTFTFQYLPDGRPVSWPAGFSDDVLAAAAGLKLPVFEPWRMVERYGVDATLKADLRHYRDEFTPTLAQSIVDFARAVMRAQPPMTSALA